MGGFVAGGGEAGLAVGGRGGGGRGGHAAVVVKGTVTTFGVFTLLVNSMNGPGLLAIPTVFQRAGWLPSIVAIVCGGYMTSETCAFLYDTIQMVRAGHAGSTPPRSRGRGGYGALASKSDTRGVGVVVGVGDEDDGVDGARKHGTRSGMEPLASSLFGSPWGAFTQVLMICSLVTLANAQIVATSQALDGLIVFMFGATYGVQYAPQWDVIASGVLSTHPFGTGKYAVTLGFLVNAVVVTWLSLQDISASATPQVISFSLFASTLAIFTWHFCDPDVDPNPVRFEEDRAPAIGDDATTLIGVVIFNFATVLVCPDVIAAQAPGSNFKRAARYSCSFMVVAYLVIGFAGSLAYPTATDNILASILFDGSPLISKVAVFAYSVSLIYPLPVYLIFIRTNLVEGGICGTYTAAMLANVVPWSLALVCYMQAWFVDVLSWSALLFLGFINYSIPLALFVQASHSAASARSGGGGGGGGGGGTQGVHYGQIVRGVGGGGGRGGGGSGERGKSSGGEKGAVEGDGGDGGGGGSTWRAWTKLCREDGKAALASVFLVVVNLVIFAGISSSLYAHFNGEAAPAAEDERLEHDSRVYRERRSNISKR